MNRARLRSLVAAPLSAALLSALVLVLGPASVAAAQDETAFDEVGLGRTLLAVESLVQQHRFQQIVELLEPFDEPGSGLKSDPDGEYAVTAELGRACYHLGRYPQAYSYLRRAVTLEPQRPETALYLQAAAFLTGRKEQAFSVFRAVVGSGARDLYLAVTLPGEVSFMSEPKVWEILGENAEPIAVDLEQGSIGPARLGDERSAVAAALGVVPDRSQSGPVLAARAGPKVIWTFRFSADGLAEMVVEAENLARYTPLRLSFGSGHDWRLTPAAAIALLGQPARADNGKSGDVTFSWDQPGCTLELVFGIPRHPRPLPIPAGAAMLRRITIKKSTSATQY